MTTTRGKEVMRHETSQPGCIVAALQVAALTCAMAISTGCMHKAVPQPAPTGSAPAPRLILQITVDALRGDLPQRYLEGMGDGGFRYLMDQGVWYTNAHHGHANTETIVGHATLATGADPSAHGMVGNLWIDGETGKLTYNIEDDDYHILTPGADVDKETGIDYTQKAASTDGRSPSSMMTSTFGDELSNFTAGRAKVFGVSVKDRGAVSMAGHSGKAFWFSKQSGEFVTSSYYYEDYPSWVNEWNEKKLPLAYAGTSWELMHTKSDYLFGDADDKAWETDFPGYGRVFPHPYGQADSKYLTTLLTLSPAGDDLTLDFAKTLMDVEELGQDDVPDYLSISFSSTDYVGHIFGPSSLEMEDNLLRLDRTLADLFAYVDKHVGLKNTIIVLSADHGTPDAPGYLNALGIPASYVMPEKWDKEPAINALKKKLGVGDEIIHSYAQPYLYLNHDVIQEKGLNQAQVEMAVAEEVMKLEGVALALSSAALREGNLPNTPIIQAVLRNYNPKRSGDIYIVFKPHYFINEFDGLSVAATHGSPWRYDSFVPIFFTGDTLGARRVHRAVETVDIAPTLSAIVGIKPPSGAFGEPLLEVLQDKEAMPPVAR
jgi:predicted AlkP superfamily pyrophosphatase or phosphodiesterase